MKLLYHGSNVPIDKVNLQKGRRGKDFGQGFYLSDDLSQAERMAKTVTEREGFGRPTVTEYAFDNSALNKANINILQFHSYTEGWARFILLNRSNKSKAQAHNYDLVYGPIADDRVGVQIRLFTQELITIETLVKELSFVKPTFQYFFGTEEALTLLDKMGVIIL